jgi:hypothetical protein
MGVDDDRRFRRFEGLVDAVFLSLGLACWLLAVAMLLLVGRLLGWL